MREVAYSLLGCSPGVTFEPFLDPTPNQLLNRYTGRAAVGLKPAHQAFSEIKGESPPRASDEAFYDLRVLVGRKDLRLALVEQFKR